jgi:membrane protein CcdC involved in cytochrome C biogenesis
MSLSRVVRQTHRWLSILFTLTVVANFVALGMGAGEPPAWVTYAPLPPLFLLLITGLYLFVLPYASRMRNRRSAAARVAAPTATEAP